jgi:hypothetical protein
MSIQLNTIRHHQCLSHRAFAPVVQNGSKPIREGRATLRRLLISPRLAKLAPLACTPSPRLRLPSPPSGSLLREGDIGPIEPSTRNADSPGPRPRMPGVFNISTPPTDSSGSAVGPQHTFDFPASRPPPLTGPQQEPPKCVMRPGNFEWRGSRPPLHLSTGQGAPRRT